MLTSDTTQSTNSKIVKYRARQNFINRQVFFNMLSTVHNALSKSCMFNLYQSGDVDSKFVIVFLDLAVDNFLIVYGKRYK